VKGVYAIQNPQKYKGDKPPVYRSSWEYEFMKVLDLTPGILEWSSESIQIPYMNPLTGRQTIYIPDFLIKLVQGGKVVTKLVEVKPVKETLAEYATSKNDAVVQLKNHAKWGAAMLWCERRSDGEGNPVQFEIMTEQDMFVGGKAIMPATRRIKPIVMPGSVTKKSRTPAKARFKPLAKLRARAKKAVSKLIKKHRPARIRKARRP
jgi:hypothetical protein